MYNLPLLLVVRLEVLLKSDPLLLQQHNRPRLFLSKELLHRQVKLLDVPSSNF